MTNESPAVHAAYAADRPRWAELPGLHGSGHGSFPRTTLVADAVRSLAHQERPPVDLQLVVNQWPGLKVSVEKLDGTGYLLDLGQRGGEILLRSQDSPWRRRFTLAHELGHWLLGHAVGAALTHDHSAGKVERWCDRFSLDLLLPPAWLSEDLSELKRSNDVAKRLFRLPERYGVSRMAAFIRVSEVSDISILMRNWNQRPGLLSGLYMSPRTGKAATVLALKRWAEGVRNPMQASIIPQMEDKSVVISTYNLTRHGEIMIVAYPQDSDPGVRRTSAQEH